MFGDADEREDRTLQRCVFGAEDLDEVRMNDGPQDDVPHHLPVRFSPAFLREERRKRRIGGCVGLVASMLTIADALYALRHHEMVNLGAGRGFLTWPPLPVLVIGLVALAASVWIAWSPGPKDE